MSATMFLMLWGYGVMWLLAWGLVTNRILDEDPVPDHGALLLLAGMTGFLLGAVWPLLLLGWLASVWARVMTR